jgi:chorismate mutase
MVGKRRGSGDDVAKQQHNKQNNPQSRERERDLLETEQREREKHDSAG